MNKIINKNTVWEVNQTKKGEKLLITQGTTLTIREGVHIAFKEIILQGNLIFVGTKESPIQCQSPIKAEKNTHTQAIYTHFTQGCDWSNVEATYCHFEGEMSYFSFSGGKCTVSDCYFSGYKTRFGASKNKIYNNQFTKMRCVELSNSSEFCNNKLKNFFLTSYSNSLGSIQQRSSDKGLYIRQDTLAFVFVESNIFENMPLAIQVARRTTPRNPRTAHIENNTFQQNQIDICLHQDDLEATIKGNNFAQTKMYHFASSLNSNSNTDKSKFETFAIGSNYYEKSAPKIHDYNNDFSCNYRFEIAAALQEKVAFSPIAYNDTTFSAKKRAVIVQLIPNFLLVKFVNWLVFFIFYCICSFQLKFTELTLFFAFMSLFLALILPINMLKEIKKWFSF